MNAGKRRMTGGIALACLTLMGSMAWASGGGKAGETRVKIRLAGTVINGVRPEGSAEYRADARRSILKVEATRVNLPNGTPLVVKVNQTTIGTLVLVAGRDELELPNSPAPRSGDVVTVQASSNAMTVTVLQGRF